MTKTPAAGPGQDDDPASFLSEDELAAVGFASVGSGALISRFVRFYGASRIHIGMGTRIDDYCVISAGAGGVTIGQFVHISIMVSIQGDGPVEICDFAGLSARTAVYSSNDDYSGRHMTNPTVDEDLTSVRVAPVRVGRHALVGAGCVILPGVSIGDGAAVGALSLVTRDCDPSMIYSGVPARRLKPREETLFALETEFWRRRGEVGAP